MEDPVGSKSLTSEEKEKIKERLCLLKKEYKRTFNRLRRSQKAERVKTHVQKTIAEQNCLLNQEGAEPFNRGSLSNFTDLTGSDADSQNKSPRPDKERKPCVTFNLEPQIFCAEGSSTYYAGSGSSSQEVEATNEAQDMGQAPNTMIQRSRLKLRRSVKRRFADQPISESSLVSDPLKDIDGLQGKVMDVTECGSPVFKKNGKHPEEQNPINLDGNCAGPGFGAENLNTLTLDTGDVTELFLGCGGTSPVIMKQCNDHFTEVGHSPANETLSDDKVTEQSRQYFHCIDNKKELSLSPSVSKTPTLSPDTDKTRIPSLFPNTEKPITSPLSPSTDKITEISLSLNTKRINESSLSPIMNKSDRSSLSPQKDNTGESSFSAGTDKSRELPLSFNMEQNKMLAQKDHTSCDPIHPSPHLSIPLCSDKNNLLNNIQDATTSTEKVNNPLNSCTLVEGLLFPVEYYVRTTRRMSSCQRKVDLDAVIHSQLGTSRRGSRGKPRLGRVSGEESSIYMSPSQRACFASEFVSNALCLTPLSHQTPNSNKRGANRGRRGRYSSPKLDMPQVSSSCDKKKVSLLESDAVTSPVSNGSQSEKENCEEQATPRLDPHTSNVCAAKRTECQPVTEGLNSQQIYILAGSEKQNTYGLRSRNTSSLLHYSLPDDIEDFENGSIIQKNMKPSNELTVNQTPERLRLCPAPSSTLPALGSAISLNKLSSCLEITDFHLPDDDFGLLKLEKLKSVSQLEPFAPLPPNATSKTRLENKILPCADHSAAFQDTEDVPNSCVLNITSNGCILYDEKSYVGPPYQTARCTKMSNAPNQECDAYPAPSVELPSPVSQIRESQELASIQKELFSLKYSQKSSRADVNSSCEVDMKHIDKDYVLHPNTRKVDNLHPVTTSPSPSKELRTQTSSEIKVPLDPSEKVEDLGSTDFQIKEAAPQFPLKEVPCSVLLSTSMCSLPLETLDDGELASCTPGLPFLGSTPVVLSAPSQASGSVLTPCIPDFEKPTATMNENLPAQSSADELRADERLKKESEQRTVVAPCSGSMSRDGDTTVNVKPVFKEKSLQEMENCVKDYDKEQSCGSQHENTLWTSEGSHLRLISQIQNSCGGECMLDLCSAQWEFPTGPEMCVVVASESAISLWRPHNAGRQWETAHSWTFTEMPVIQLLPLPGEKNILCVALGNLEILEIWALFSCPRGLNWEQRVVKLGHTETARGLSRLRLVCSSGLGPNQEVEILQLSEKGRVIKSHTLQSPEASIMSFSEVQGQADAIVGSTVDNKVVIWNGGTGQLLSTINVGELCGDSACLSAYSNSGLLFLVLASPYSNSLEAARKCIFRLIATNPKSELCAHVMSYTLPEGQDGRFLEGDTIDHCAATVLTSGSVAFWDLSRSLCSTILLPDADIHWSLVRWAHSMSHVLAGQKNGNICVYSYTELDPKEDIKEFEKNRFG